MPSAILSRCLALVCVAAAPTAGCGGLFDDDDGGGGDSNSPSFDEDPYSDPCDGPTSLELRAVPEYVPTATRLRGVSARGTGEAVAVGSAGMILQRDVQGLWRSRDGGVLADLHGVARGPEASTVVAVGDGGAIVRSVDGGETWAAVDGGTTADLYAVTFTPQRFAVAVGEGVILRSVDDGATFAPVELAGELGTLRAITSEPYLLAVGDAGLAVRSQDGGETWEVTDVGTNADLYAVSSAIASDLFVSGRYFTITGESGRLSVADGEWRDVYVVDPPSAFYAMSPLTRWLVGSDGQIRVNRDEGSVEVVDAEGTFASGVGEDLLAVDGGDSWALIVGARGTALSIREVAVAEDGTECY